MIDSSLSSPGTPPEAVFCTQSLAPDTDKKEVKALITADLVRKGRAKEPITFEEYQRGAFPGLFGYMAMTGWFIPGAKPKRKKA